MRVSGEDGSSVADFAPRTGDDQPLQTPEAVKDK